MKKILGKCRTIKARKLFKNGVFLLMGVLVIAYIVLSIIPITAPFAEIVPTIAAMLAAMGFWIDWKNGKEISEATFIMELNDQFISNAALTRIEQKLMSSYAQWTNRETHIGLDLDLRLESEDRKDLINYLVYLEGLASIVKCRAMQSDMIADLFAYRFFIAVNNPIVQQVELLPYENYYHGCYTLSEIWTSKWNNEQPKREIPFVRATEKANDEYDTEGVEPFILKNDHTLFQVPGESRGKRTLAYENEKLNRPVFPPKGTGDVEC